MHAIILCYLHICKEEIGTHLLSFLCKALTKYKSQKSKVKAEMQTSKNIYIFFSLSVFPPASAVILKTKFSYSYKKISSGFSYKMLTSNFGAGISNVIMIPNAV